MPAGVPRAQVEKSRPFLSFHALFSGRLVVDGSWCIKRLNFSSLILVLFWVMDTLTTNYIYYYPTILSADEDHVTLSKSRHMHVVY